MSQAIGDHVDTASEEARDKTEEWDVSESDGPPSRGPPGPLSLDVVFDMLKNERRRRVLHYLREHEGPFTLGEVAEHIAALENDKSVQALSSGERKRVYVGLYQCHLPRMDDAGVIEFDRNRGSIELGPNVDQLDEFLEVESTAGAAEWSKYYLGVSGVGTALFLAVEMGGLAPGWVSTLLVVALLGTIGACSLVQHYREELAESLGERASAWL